MNTRKYVKSLFTLAIANVYGMEKDSKSGNKKYMSAMKPAKKEEDKIKKTSNQQISEVKQGKADKVNSQVIKKSKQEEKKIKKEDINQELKNKYEAKIKQLEESLEEEKRRNSTLEEEKEQHQQEINNLKKEEQRLQVAFACQQADVAKLKEERNYFLKELNKIHRKERSEDYARHFASLW